MSAKELKVKVKNYFDKKMNEEFQRMFGKPQYNLSEEDVRKLLYFIKFSDEIINEYGSLETIDTMTKYERLSIEKLRKISILKNLPLKEWTNLELEDLIYEYEIYYIFTRVKEVPVSIHEFLHKGLYEHFSMYENLKSVELNPKIIKFKKVKSIKLKKN